MRNRRSCIKASSEKPTLCLFAYDSVAQALAASSRAVTLPARKWFQVSGTVAQVNPVLCKGCGLCVASCRSGALNLKGFGEDQIMAMINEM